jgi:hypothetical protein
METKTFFGRLGFWLWCNVRLFSIWAKIYQFFRERQWETIVRELPRFSHAEDLAPTLTHMQYRYDGIAELGDVCSSAKAVWGRYKNQMKVGDCEDFANFIASVIRDNITAGRWTDPVWADCMVMLIAWKDVTGAMMGHGVGLLIGAKDGKVCYAYQDYGDPSRPCASLEELSELVRLHYAGAGNTSLGWAIFQPGSLKLMRSSWK